MAATKDPDTSMPRSEDARRHPTEDTEKLGDIEKEIAKAMPWLKLEELEAMRIEQELDSATLLLERN